MAYISRLVPDSMNTDPLAAQGPPTKGEIKVWLIRALIIVAILAIAFLIFCQPIIPFQVLSNADSIQWKSGTEGSANNLQYRIGSTYISSKDDANFERILRQIKWCRGMKCSAKEEILGDTLIISAGNETIEIKFNSDYAYYDNTWYKINTPYDFIDRVAFLSANQ